DTAGSKGKEASKYTSPRKGLGDKAAGRAPKEKPSKPKKESQRVRLGPSQPTAKPKPSGPQQSVIRGITYYKAAQPEDTSDSASSPSSSLRATCMAPRSCGTLPPSLPCPHIPAGLGPRGAGSSGQSPAKGASELDRPEEKNPKSYAAVEAQGRVSEQAETTPVSSTRPPSTTRAPSTTTRSPPVTILPIGDRADGTGGLEAPNRDVGSGAKLKTPHKWSLPPGILDPLVSPKRERVTWSVARLRTREAWGAGRWSNLYKLPYNWIGTGHVVYQGAFYYNRAFTKNIIKYDLRQRFVAAWALLHDVVYEDTTPWKWRGHSDIDFAVDESGLWVIYPAVDYDDSQLEVIVLSKLDPGDLSMKRETTWKTGLKRNSYGNCFIICGILYAVDVYNQKDGQISYAYDTHTDTEASLKLPFLNQFSFTTQIDYNPKEKVLYAWDNGHQVTYRLRFVL
uniref:Olfactomedin like 2A n=1 Tax=Pelodiscus sinensis TaxID=13735 RepID=K7FLV6_PELSI